MFAIKSQFIRDDEAGVALWFQVTSGHDHSFWVLDIWVPGIPGGISRVMSGLDGVPEVDRCDLADLAKQAGFDVTACYLSVHPHDKDGSWVLSVASSVMRFGGKSYLFDKTGEFMRAGYFTNPTWEGLFVSQGLHVVKA